MNAKVVDLADRRPDPHVAGPARCLACKHEWAAVAPTGTLWLECPECSLLRGRFLWPVERSGLPHWVCGCGNDVFHVTPQGYYCPNCGVWATGF